MVDFHAHHPGKETFLCTADGSVPMGCAYVPCTGLLPCFWSKERESSFLEAISNNAFGIGEIGLDKRFVRECPMDEQIRCLRQYLIIGNETRRIMTLHCVHATGEMIGTLRKCVSKQSKVIWHGFNGSVETSSILAGMGIVTSIRPSFRGDVKALFASNPKTVLETDYEGTDDEEYNEVLSRHYERMASELGISRWELEEHCNAVAEAFTDKPIHR